MRGYQRKVEVVTSNGDVVHHVPGAWARALVEGAAAAIHNQNGKVHSVRLLQPASTHAERLGPSSPQQWNVQFYRWVNLDCGARIVEHHPRSTDYD